METPLVLPEGRKTPAPLPMRVLAALVEAEGEPLTNLDLMTRVYSDRASGAYPSMATIRVTVHALRSYLFGLGEIVTAPGEKGAGYLLDAATLRRLTGQEPWT